jgi:hypothetical protein
MKIHEYNEMMAHLTRRRPMSNGGFIYNQRHGAKRFTQETIDKYLELRDTMNKAQIQKELDISPAKQGKIDKEYGLDRRKSIVTDRKFSPEDIEEFKRIRPFTSETDIQTKLGMSKSYQTQLARELGLPSKTGKQVLSKKIAEAESVVPTIKKMIDPNKSPTENLKEIYPKIKDKTFKKGTTQFGKPTEDRVRRAISNALMDVNQLSVEEYKDEIRKMIANRNYAPKGLDPLRIKTDELKNYAIPNYKQAKAELAEEIPSLDRRLQTNINIRKKLKRKQKEIADPSLKLSRLSQRARRKQIGRLEKLGLTTTLSPREEAINQTQTSIQKSSNDRIKANPEAMKKFLQDNPEKLKALGTRVNRQTGEIFYENPNLGFLNKDPKDTQRFFELDHGREISKQAGRLTDVPENRNTIPGLLNRGFKRDAEIYIESNPNPKDPKVQAVLEEAKKLKVRIRPKVPTGTFKADDFFRPVANPLLKISDNISFYAPNEFQTKEVVLPRDKTGKVVLGLSTKQPGGPTLGSTMIQPELANLDTRAARNLFSSAGKIALGELGFAGPSVVLDTYAGLTPSEMALNVVTFGLGVPLKDSVQKRKFIADAGFGSDYSSALTKRRNLRTAPKDAVGQLTDREKQAIFLANAFDARLDLQRAEQAEAYKQRQQSQLKRGELEVPDAADVPEEIPSIQPEFQEETTETRSLPFGLDRLLPFDDDEII